MRLRLLAFIAAVGVLSLAACGNDDSPVSSDTAGIVSADSTTISGDQTDVTPVTADPDVTVLVDDSGSVGDSSEPTITLDPGESPLTIRPNGLGAFNFGAPADTVISALTDRFGAPTADSGWGPQESPCDQMGEMARYISWGWLHLSFSNGPDVFGPAGNEHFSAYNVYDPGDGTADPKLTTDDGGPLLGVKVVDLAVRFPGTKTSAHEIRGPIFERPDGLIGGVDADSAEGVVTSVDAGNICID